MQSEVSVELEIVPVQRKTISLDSAEQPDH